jgi:hypothetical protein
MLDDCVGGGAQQMSAEESIVREAEREGFCLDDIRDKVGAVMDTSRQENLRNEFRNRRITKTVLDKRGDCDVLIGGSSDLVLIFDCHTGNIKFFVKADMARQDGKLHYVVKEQDYLRRWPALPSNKYQTERAHMSRKLTVLANVVRLYLG